MRNKKFVLPNSNQDYRAHLEQVEIVLHRHNEPDTKVAKVRRANIILDSENHNVSKEQFERWSVVMEEQNGFIKVYFPVNTYFLIQNQHSK